MISMADQRDRTDKWGLPKIRGTCLGASYNEDYDILGSTVGSPYFGKLPNCSSNMIQGFLKIVGWAVPTETSHGCPVGSTSGITSRFEENARARNMIYDDCPGFFP